MSAYLLGLATLPTLALIGWLLLHALAWAVVTADDHGFTVEFKAARNPNRVSDFTLRNDIWSERQRGPIFTGHWYREERGIDDSAYATRWLGIGSATGRSVMFFHKRNLGAPHVR